jgi:hypothetical protein
MSALAKIEIAASPTEVRKVVSSGPFLLSKTVSELRDTSVFELYGQNLIIHLHYYPLMESANYIHTTVPRFFQLAQNRRLSHPLYDSLLAHITHY